MDSERPAKACKLDKGTRSSASVDGKTSPVYHHKATSSITGSSANSSSAVLPSSGHIDGATRDADRIQSKLCVKS